MIDNDLTALLKALDMQLAPWHLELLKGMLNGQKLVFTMPRIENKDNYYRVIAELNKRKTNAD